jgi:cytidine deaminase
MTADLNLADIVAELKAARGRACVPLIPFSVAAVIRTLDGHYFTGVNTQTADMTLSECAERAAVFAMVSAVGPRQLSDVWVMGGPREMQDGAQAVTPCGGCRQVLACFVSPDCVFHQVSLSGDVVQSLPFRELLPYGFGFRDIGLQVDFQTDEANVAPARFRGIKV